MTILLRPSLCRSVLCAATALGHLPTIAAPPLRELSTDRPDTTESPRTVDGGHFQYELEIAAWERNGSERTLNLGELNPRLSRS